MTNCKATIYLSKPGCPTYRIDCDACLTSSKMEAIDVTSYDDARPGYHRKFVPGFAQELYFCIKRSPRISKLEINL